MAFRKKMDSQLNNFMRDGLRVLCFARRYLTMTESALLMVQLSTFTDEIDMQDKLERGLSFLGLAALADQLSMSAISTIKKV